MIFFATKKKQKFNKIERKCDFVTVCITWFILQDPEPGDEDEDDKDKKKDKSSSGTGGSTDPNNKRKESKKDDQVLKKE